MVRFSETIVPNGLCYLCLGLALATCAFGREDTLIDEILDGFGVGPGKESIVGGVVEGDRDRLQDLQAGPVAGVEGMPERIAAVEGVESQVTLRRHLQPRPEASRKRPTGGVGIDEAGRP